MHRIPREKSYVLYVRARTVVASLIVLLAIAGFALLPAKENIQVACEAMACSQSLQSLPYVP